MREAKCGACGGPCACVDSVASGTLWWWTLPLKACAPTCVWYASSSLTCSACVRDCTSRVTRHTSHLTPHTSHLTPHRFPPSAASRSATSLSRLFCAAQQQQQKQSGPPPSLHPPHTPPPLTPPQASDPNSDGRWLPPCGVEVRPAQLAECEGGAQVLQRRVCCRLP